MPTTYSTQDDGKPETDMNLIGQGKALVFEDGGVISGSWNKTSASAQNAAARYYRQADSVQSG